MLHLSAAEIFLHENNCIDDEKSVYTLPYQHLLKAVRFYLKKIREGNCGKPRHFCDAIGLLEQNNDSKMARYSAIQPVKVVRYGAAQLFKMHRYGAVGLTREVIVAKLATTQ